MPATDETIEYARSAAKGAIQKLATDVVVLDVSEQLVITDAFVIASASNSRQVDAIVDGVEETLLKEHGLKPKNREGRGEGTWVLLDYSDIVVHVFNHDDREFYGLERLWKDSPVISIPEVQNPDTVNDTDSAYNE
ncbi:ribosome-associated protein [Brevibacterium paucivorans]|uniref:Ribosomal silencing factor RsfS n=1 Tax=Brevibacterium paucivorans TaxID=170994 RepID=A0ABS2SGW8_9MICO|nr:ribosome silencing factor [Brevibacterium paucivorans]MBM7815492.1 ribosome-associated protein [Brevibacterium paucivorans]